MNDSNKDTSIYRCAEAVAEASYDSTMAVLENHDLNDSDAAAAVIQGLTAIVLDCALDMEMSKEEFLNFMSLMYEKSKTEPENMVNANGGCA